MIYESNEVNSNRQWIEQYHGEGVFEDIRGQGLLPVHTSCIVRTSVLQV